MLYIMSFTFHYSGVLISLHVFISDYLHNPQGLSSTLLYVSPPSLFHEPCNHTQINWFVFFHFNQICNSNKKKKRRRAGLNIPSSADCSTELSASRGNICTNFKWMFDTVINTSTCNVSHAALTNWWIIISSVRCCFRRRRRRQDMRQNLIYVHIVIYTYYSYTSTENNTPRWCQRSHLLKYFLLWTSLT